MSAQSLGDLRVNKSALAARSRFKEDPLVWWHLAECERCRSGTIPKSAGIK